MNTTYIRNSIALAISSAALTGISHAQVRIGASGVNMNGTGRISNAPVIIIPSQSGGTQLWSTSPLLQGFVVPAGQLTGLTTAGTAVSYEDLIPFKTSRISIVTGAPGSAPTGSGTIIDGEGIETNGLTLLDAATNTSASISIQGGRLAVNGSAFPALGSGPDGSAVFPGTVVLDSPGGSLRILGNTPAASSTTGALTVAGGIGIGMDSYINGVRIGRGAGNVSSNTVLGSSALHNNTWAPGNSAFGTHSLHANTTGWDNSAFGSHALYSNTTGGFNVAIGSSAGMFHANGTTALSAANNSIYIGAHSRGKDNGDNNSIVIGANAIGEGANTTVIGNTTTTMTRLHGETNVSALRVTGNVIIEQAQGDISMGIYQ